MRADLFLVSFLSLFFELLVIRWIPSVVGPIAYFTNLVLIFAFLGLGLGCLLVERPARLMRFFPAAALLTGSIVAILQHLQVYTRNNSAVFMSAPSFLQAPDAAPAVPIVFILCILCFLIVSTFVCVGQEVGRRLKDFPPLKAYSLNIFGSLAGVGAFSLFAWMRLSPVFWFALAGLVAVWLLREDRFWAALAATAFLGLLLAIGSAGPNVYWSPYYRIHVAPFYEGEGQARKLVGNEIDVNALFHQFHLDLSGSAGFSEETENFLSPQRELYDLPYRFIRPDRVLVLGAGGGNDVAAALRAGAGHVDAVEIDPVIADLGRRLHPERPYSDSRVRVIVDDARSFLRRSPDKYDLIVLGFLDTLRLLNEFSSVRLDSYVYTRECFREIAKHLKPGASMALGFSTTTPWIQARLYGLMRETFGSDPLIYSGIYGRPTILFGGWAGTPVFLRMKHLVATPTAPLKELLNDLPTPTDDWPFLYMRRHFIPYQYAFMMLAVLLVTVAVVFWATPQLGIKFQWHFFFLGAAFMLVETLSITRLARFFGSTWIVTSIVIALILSTIMAANRFVEGQRRLPIKIVYAALILTLLVCYFARGMTSWMLCACVGLAVFIAGLAFASAFRVCSVPVRAFGANILGAVTGGLLENFSLIWGLQTLYLFVIALYLISFFTRLER